MHRNTTPLPYRGPWGETTSEKRSRTTHLRWRIRDRKPLEASLAAGIWSEYLETHHGNTDAALGELVAALLAARLLNEEARW